MTNVYWVKGHTGKGGKLADCHEKENKRADEDAETAYKHPCTPEYRVGYISQLDSVYGSTIDEKVVVNNMGTTVLRNVQVKQHLRYWEARSRAGAWARNADIEGHAAASRRAQKANPNTVCSGSYKGKNGRRLKRDLEHQRDHRYDPSELTTGTVWSAETIDSRISSEDGDVADVLSQLVAEESINSISEATPDSEAIDAPALSAITQEMIGGQIHITHTDIIS